ncbi:MAG: DUF5615 family PIN-like protein [Phycisphaerae bacterium]|nr:DUF5615 family PIN-like protein [Phycisphaerae bacterium]
MVVKVKLDEDLSPIVGEPLRGAGCAVLSVVEQGWSGLKEPDLWPRVVSEGAFFITADKGVGDVRAYPPGTHSGILLLRPDGESLLEYRDLAAGFVEKYKFESLIGAVAVATPRGVRARRQPPSEAGRA